MVYIGLINYLLTINICSQFYLNLCIFSSLLVIIFKIIIHIRLMSNHYSIYNSYLEAKMLKKYIYQIKSKKNNVNINHILLTKLIYFLSCILVLHENVRIL
jgi:hypothetical protein